MTTYLRDWVFRVNAIGSRFHSCTATTVPLKTKGVIDSWFSGAGIKPGFVGESEIEAEGFGIYRRS